MRGLILVRLRINCVSTLVDWNLVPWTERLSDLVFGLLLIVQIVILIERLQVAIILLLIFNLKDINLIILNCLSLWRKAPTVLLNLAFWVKWLFVIIKSVPLFRELAELILGSQSISLWSDITLMRIIIAVLFVVTEDIVMGQYSFVLDYHITIMILWILIHVLFYFKI